MNEESILREMDTLKHILERNSKKISDIEKEIVNINIMNSGFYDFPVLAAEIKSDVVATIDILRSYYHSDKNLLRILDDLQKKTDKLMSIGERLSKIANY